MSVAAAGLVQAELWPGAAVTREVDETPAPRPRTGRTRVEKPWRIRFVTASPRFDPYLWGRALALSEYTRARYLLWIAGLREGVNYVVEHRDRPGEWNARLTRDETWVVSGSSR